MPILGSTKGDTQMIQKKTFLLLLTVALIMAVIGLIAPLTVIAAPAQVLNIGVIGQFDSPVAEGVTLALRRFSAQGIFTTPDGKSYTLSVITANATTPQQVSDAITELKKSNV